MNQQEMMKAREATSNVAVIVMHYYSELKKVGFTDQQALKLTCECQKSLWNNSTNKD